ncbi:putative ribose-5-phosphate isomerase B [Fimicolochytrium jonesii]|uniref:putative ribose-5-phosphate isomerase B n=1 Tax=Fimicolochytrium jonesii TaxID=1396493 RepID=UPI0022FEC618|nr:putative ribose-5-phosphate isomerase B [Fimicolochytrium jonesii]KAI8816013.1 putative ribose-5-phosphate isomerase B [Fimicolochytrium jonesii]
MPRSPPSSLNLSSAVLHRHLNSSIPAKNLLIIASDHIGIDLKKTIREFLTNDRAGEGWDVLDVGPHDAARCDYPDYARLAAEAVLSKDKPSPTSSYTTRLGVLICGTGIGMSIAANKGQGIRCALCHDQYTATMARQHNDANMLALGCRTTGADVAKGIVASFLGTRFEAEHHVERLRKLHALEGVRYSL